MALLLVHSHNVLRVGAILVAPYHPALRHKDGPDEVAVRVAEALPHEQRGVCLEVCLQSHPVFAA